MLEYWTVPARTSPSNRPTDQLTHARSSWASGARRRRHRQRHLLAPPRVLLRDLRIAALDLLAQQLIVEDVAAGRLWRGFLQSHHESGQDDTGANRAALSHRRGAEVAVRKGGGAGERNTRVDEREAHRTPALRRHFGLGQIGIAGQTGEMRDSVDGSVRDTDRLRRRNCFAR